MDELIIGNSNGDLVCFELDEDACNGAPLFIERNFWTFSPSSAVSELENYYSRYFPYCIAHTPTEVLRTMFENGDSDIFSLNALELYSMADQLEYVRLIESDDGTTCELLLDSGWVSVSRENYYRFVVHPRILFEVPARIDADYWLTEADTLELSMEEWLRYEPDRLCGETENHVWRGLSRMG